MEPERVTEASQRNMGMVAQTKEIWSHMVEAQTQKHQVDLAFAVIHSALSRHRMLSHKIASSDRVFCMICGADVSEWRVCEPCGISYQPLRVL